MVLRPNSTKIRAMDEDNLIQPDQSGKSSQPKPDAPDFDADNLNDTTEDLNVSLDLNDTTEIDLESITEAENSSKDVLTLYKHLQQFKLWTRKLSAIKRCINTILLRK